MLIDVHAHFHLEGGAVADAVEQNENRIKYSKKCGITKIIASALGSFGLNSPIYLPSMEDSIAGNRRMAQIAKVNQGLVYSYCFVNPNYEKEALDEFSFCIEKLGMVGLKLGASVKCTSPVLEPLVEKCVKYNVPILHHIFQRRTVPSPGQDASDALDLARLASKFPKAKIIQAHIGGGGDWEYGIKAAAAVKNIWLDISGSGVDSGMLEMAVETVGAERMLFGTDVTIATGAAKFEALDLPRAKKDLIAYKNALKLFGDKLK